MPAFAELPRWDAGFDPNVRTVWLAEGLVNYIPEAGLRTLLSSLAEVGPSTISIPDTLPVVHGTLDSPQHRDMIAAHILAGRVHLQTTLLTLIC